MGVIIISEETTSVSMLWSWWGFLNGGGRGLTIERVEASSGGVLKGFVFTVDDITRGLTV